MLRIEYRIPHEYSEVRALSRSVLLLLSGDVERLKEQLAQANNDNEQKQIKLDDLAEKVRAIEEQSAIAAHKKIVRKSIILLALGIAWKIIAAVGAVIATWTICKLFQLDFGTWLSVIIGIVSLGAMGVAIVKKDLRKHFERCKQ